MPLTADRAIGYLELGGDLVVSQSAEEFQFHDAAFSRVELLESCQGLVDFQKVTGSFPIVKASFIKRRLKGAASSLRPPPSPSMVDEDSPH
jgi:hypothetical protein